MYKPKQPFNVAAKIRTATTKKVNGINQKTFVDGDNFFCSARSFGGTERVVNNVYVIEDTMLIETYFRNDIKADCHIVLLDDNSEWEIISDPENIERRNQFLSFKVRRIKGGA